MNTETQQYIVLKHILEEGSIISLEAFSKYEITRLSARIFELRNMGVKIFTEERAVKNKFGKYKIFTKDIEDAIKILKQITPKEKK